MTSRAPEKPAKRKGQVCYSARWDREGKLIQALYRPEKIAKAAAQPELF